MADAAELSLATWLIPFSDVLTPATSLHRFENHPRLSLKRQREEDETHVVSNRGAGRRCLHRHTIMGSGKRFTSKLIICDSGGRGTQD